MASLLRRLRKTPKVLHEYDKVVKEQESKGIIESFSVEAAEKIHYFPYGEVMRSDQQSTKLVFYASSKRHGPSLNDCLYASLPLLPLLIDVIVRFRCFKIALVGDIG